MLVLLCGSATTASAQSAGSKTNANAAAAANRKAALIDTGRTVFNQRCEICHFIDSNAQKIGPGLRGLFVRAQFIDRTRVTDASAAGIIMDGGKDMPPFEGILKPGQLQALIAYLKSH